MSLLMRINLWLCVAFACFLAAAISISRAALHDDAREDAVAEARLLMDSAQAARDYTSGEIEPLLRLGARGAVHDLHPQTIPAYAATRIFDALRQKRPEYAYREAVLNPTNPRDRAQMWEADVIEHFRNDRSVAELVNERNGELGRSLYLAKPVRIDDAQCLACHDTAANAPEALVRQYGSANGFGWKLHETVGAQIVSVPLEAALAGADRAVWVITGVLCALFVLLFVVVNVVVRAVVLRPVARLAAAAQSISLGQAVSVDLQVPGGDEVSQLCRSFERMRISVEKSMALLRKAT